MVVADFIYTTCPDVCPALTARMAQLQTILQQEGLLESKVTLLSFSVDPEHEPPAVLRRYAQQYDADQDSWRFLTTDSVQEMTHILVDGFKVAASPLAAAEDHANHSHSNDSHDDNIITHTTRFVLIDPYGSIRAYYRGDEIDLTTVVNDVRELIR